MSNPLQFIPYAIAAAGGSVDGYDVRALVASGSTLLQRCAPLVRAIAISAPASLLPPGAAFVTALGASDGHALLVLDTDESLHRIRQALAMTETRVVFTKSTFAAHVPDDHICVLLDHVPQFATVRLSAAEERVIDLGSHVGLAIEGESGATGSDEPVLQWYDSGTLRSTSHREVMSGSTGGWAGELIRQLLRAPENAAAESENA